MSYDLHVGKDWHNYTYNMWKFFQDFNVYPPDWDGKLRTEVGDQIDDALELIRLHNIDTLGEKYDAPNGWGSVQGAIKFLEAVRDSCRWQAPEIVRVS